MIWFGSTVPTIFYAIFNTRAKSFWFKAVQSWHTTLCTVTKDTLYGASVKVYEELRESLACLSSLDEKSLGGGRLFMGGDIRVLLAVIKCYQ